MWTESIHIGGNMVYRPTSRVLTVLELLQTHGQMTAQELATMLEVAPRTIRRYITTLQDIGIPVESELGRDGGYALRPGFKLPPLMFTDEEVLVLTLGLMRARQSGVDNANIAVASALAKVERVLPFALRETLRALVESMQIEALPDVTVISAAVLSTLSTANRQCQQVKLSYQTRDRVTERHFDSYAIICHQEQWYTVGYCHLRHELRTFRLDRIQDVQLLPAHFTPPANFDALEYMLSSFEAIPDQWNVDVLLNMSLDAVRSHIPRSLATLVDTPQGVRLRASIRDLNDMALILIRLGCPIKVINPPELRDEFLSIAERIMRDAGS
jgi:predicted DNA-binding transcriptional regulator YafY